MATSKIKIIENLEQRSDEWLNLRLGRIGGSSATNLMTTTRFETLFYEKLTEILTNSGIDYYSSNAMIRGVEYEPIAKYSYELENSVTVREVGYILNSDFRYAGLSPDGLINSYGAIEIKCPTSKTHIKSYISNEIPLNYLHQIAWYFVIYPRLRWVDYFSYDDRVSYIPYFQKRVRRKDIYDIILDITDKYFLFESRMDEVLTSIGFFNA
jgi:putative phage-type endonuclease